jgi:glutamate---cysteine ligase / carboxylate-amine ligase
MASGGRDEFTLGMEEEYQLVSSASGDLTSRARHVLAADWAGELQAEVHESMLEVGTHVCRGARELRDEIRRLRLQVASTAATEDLRVVAAGIHPYSRWQDQLMSRGERYDAIREHYARVVRTEHVFGMHIHVAVPGGVDRIPLLRGARWFTPHLLALSCSSPIYEGRDTGFSSYRHILWRRLPLTGPFPGVRSEEEYARFTELLVRTGAAMDNATIYWSIRPHPEYPTIEFRITDVCPRLEDAVAIAVLARGVTAATAAGALTHPTTGLVDTADVAVIAANEWTVARYGLDAKIIVPGRDTGTEAIRDSVRRLLEVVTPFAAEFGDEEALAGVETILERGNASDRIRERAPLSRELPALVDWLAGESMLGTGLDRRMEQREVERNGDEATAGSGAS